MKRQQRQKWLGLAALYNQGNICQFCVGGCEEPNDVAFLGDCTAFNPGTSWQQAGRGLSEAEAEIAYRQAIAKQAAKVKAEDELKRANWERQVAAMQGLTVEELRVKEHSEVRP